MENFGETTYIPSVGANSLLMGLQSSNRIILLEDIVHFSQHCKYLPVKKDAMILNEYSCDAVAGAAENRREVHGHYYIPVIHTASPTPQDILDAAAQMFSEHPSQRIAVFESQSNYCIVDFQQTSDGTVRMLANSLFVTNSSRLKREGANGQALNDELLAIAADYAAITAARS
jgi:hypothetical protein